MEGDQTLGAEQSASVPDAGLRVGKDSRGKEFDIDPAVLTKHALVLGATGSGKTVFCKAIIEEAALRGIPVIAIDPKGDISALAIRSKDFQFRPYSDVEADALRRPRDAYAQGLQNEYSEKMKEEGISPDKVANFAEGVDVKIYTPKSSAGIPVSISPKLDPPPDYQEMVRKDPNTVSDLLDLSVTSLLKIVRPGDDDRRAASYLSEILRAQWGKGESADLKALIDLVQRPPFTSVGGIPLDQYFPRKERIKLAGDLSGFNVDPRLQGWVQGEPLDFDRLFQKGPRTPVNVFYLKGIQTEEERSFFVETLLRQLYSWVMKQQGVQNLRFLLYFDEVVGYCPPIREPPSKKGLLLLIKQGRAFGLGIVLATQNPGDIDYKALSNVNVRLIGRLLTQRDIDKVKVGLDLPEDSALTIQTLEKAKFLCQISDPRTSGLVSPRWLMSYHRGPLQDEEVSELMREFKEGTSGQDAPPAPSQSPEREEKPLPSQERIPEPEEPAPPPEPPAPVPPAPLEIPVETPVLGIPFVIKAEGVPDRVKRQKKMFGPEEVVVKATPMYRLLLELGISQKTGVLTKTHQTRYAVMDATTGQDVELGRRLVLKPGLEALLGLDSRDVQVLRNVPDGKYTSAIELAAKLEVPEDLVRDSLRELEGRRLAKSMRVGNAKTYQRITIIPSLDLVEARANLSAIEPFEVTPPPKGRSEAELREVVRGLRDDYDLVSYRPFYYPLYSVDLALGRTARTVWIDGVTGEETRL